VGVEAITLPAPYGGLDVVSPIDNTEPIYALELVNVYPSPSAPSVRKGYKAWKDILGFDTRTLVPYTTSAGVEYLVGCYGATGNSSIVAYNTNKTEFLLNPSGTYYTTPEWQHVVYAGRLYLCNGSDTPVYWDGSAASVAPITFTGPTLTKLVNVTAYKERLYFVELGTCKVWYGGLQVTGTGGTPALTSFDFQYVFNRGGRLIGIGSYSNTANLATQDYFWACSSEGEIVFYTGTYAGDPSTWGMVARYYIGAPLGYRAFVRVNNDVWIITQQGIVPISALFQSDPQQALQAVSYRINPIISQWANTIGFDHQWAGFFWPQGRRVYISVPVSGEGCLLLVYSLDVKGWTTYRLKFDSDCLSSCLFNNSPFFASVSGTLWQGETGYLDCAVSGTPSDPWMNSAIAFSGRMAFNPCGSRNNYKAFKDIRPLLKTQAGMTLNLGLDTDFKRLPTVTSVTTNPGTYTPWGSPWGSPWSGDVQVVFDRFATKGQGHWAAVRFGGSVANFPLEFYGFELRFDVGGQV
jgi:hypothetical protein